MSEDFDAIDPRRALATHYTWFHLGSKLYHASQMTTPKDPLPEVPSLVVGAVYAGDVTDPCYYWSDFERIPLMLYGMAVECWLKGIIVMRMPEPVREELHELLREPSPTCLEDYFQGEIFEAVQKIVDTNAKTDRKLTEEALCKLKGLGDHNLNRMAEEAGLELSDIEKKLLAVLSDAIVLGRYPARFKQGRQVGLSKEVYKEVMATLGKKINALAR